LIGEPRNYFPALKVGDIPLELAVPALRVLQEGDFRAAWLDDYDSGQCPSAGRDERILKVSIDKVPFVTDFISIGSTYSRSSAVFASNAARHRRYWSGTFLASHRGPLGKKRGYDRKRDMSLCFVFMAGTGVSLRIANLRALIASTCRLLAIEEPGSGSSRRARLTFRSLDEFQARAISLRAEHSG